MKTKRKVSEETRRQNQLADAYFDFDEALGAILPGLLNNCDKEIAAQIERQLDFPAKLVMQAFATQTDYENSHECIMRVFSENHF